MSVRKIKLVEGEFFHIYNRGNSKQKIFHDKQDYRYFTSLLYLANGNNPVKSFDLFRNNKNSIYKFDKGEPFVSIGVYVLMPNHFHILLTGLSEDGVTKFMQKLATGYVMYYNQKYKRTGSLFEGKFKAKHADTDNYLKYLFAYIHLNPVKLTQKDWKEVGIKNKNQVMSFLEEYEYSSFMDWIKVERVESVILSTKSFPNYFKSTNDFKKELFSWIDIEH